MDILAAFFLIINPFLAIYGAYQYASRVDCVAGGCYTPFLLLVTVFVTSYIIFDQVIKKRTFKYPLMVFLMSLYTVTLVTIGLISFYFFLFGPYKQLF